MAVIRITSTTTARVDGDGLVLVVVDPHDIERLANAIGDEAARTDDAWLVDIAQGIFEALDAYLEELNEIPK